MAKIDQIWKYDYEEGAFPASPSKMQEIVDSVNALYDGEISDTIRVGNEEPSLNEKIWIQISDNLFDEVFRQGGANGTNDEKNIFSANNILLKAGTYYFKTNLDINTFQWAIFGNTQTYPTSNAVSFNSTYKTLQEYTFTFTKDLYFGLMLKKTAGGNLVPNEMSNYTFMLSRVDKNYEPYVKPAIYIKDGDSYSKLTDTVSVGYNSNNAGLFIEYENLFNINSLIKGYELIGSTGNISVNNDYYVSDYTPIAPNTKIYVSGKISGSSYSFYDSNKTFISTVALSGGVGELTTPNNSNVAYMRYNGKITELINNIVVSTKPTPSIKIYNNGGYDDLSGWKIIGTKQGADSVPFPSDAHEILAIVKVNDNENVFIPINIPFDLLTNNERGFNNGYYQDVNTNAFARVHVTKTTGYLNKSYLNGGDVRNWTWTVWYYK